MAQHTIQIPITEDTYIDMNNPSTNYGSSTELRAGGGKRYESDVYRNYKIEFLLKWDNVSYVPVRKKILSKYLCMYALTTWGTYCKLYAASPKDFDEMVATWDNWRGTSTHVSTDNIDAQEDGINKYLKFNILNSSNFNGLCEVGAEDFASSSSVLKFSSRESENPPYIEVTYEDVPPNAPAPTEPIGVYKDSKSITRFSWQYNSDMGGIQKAFDLQWSIDQSTWTTISQTTANNYYDMAADTLSAGNIYWRVRCYNEYDEVGDYCAIQSFYAIGAPAAPVLNTVPSNTARPIISWSAFSQQVYQLQVLSGDDVVYDSGTMPGINVRQHKVKAWLADGSYTVKLRIKNEYDMWSEWGISAVTISTVKPAKPSLTLQRSAYGVEINATGLVYRSDYNKDDYICIGEAAGTFYDNTVRCDAEYKYFVRAVSEDDTYNDSDVKFIQAAFRHALIAPASDLTNVFAFTRSLNSPPKRTYNRQSGGAFVEYAGRKSPVWEPTEHVSAGWSMTFYLKTWSEVETFTEIYDLNGTVLYRDAKGRKMYGTLSNLSVNDDILGYIISFTLSQVDYTESVEV